MKNATLTAISKQKPLFKPSFLIPADTTIREAARLMNTKGCSILGVGHKQHVEGAIAAYDIVTQAVAKGVDLDTTPVCDIMTRKLTSSQPPSPKPRPRFRKPGMLTYGTGIKT